MPDLVTLEEAKASIRYLDDSSPSIEDDDLYLRLQAAHALVLDYVGQHRVDHEDWQAIVDAWTAEDVPPQVKAAILYVFGDSYRFRGDDDKAPDGGSSLLPGRARMWLDLLRDPTLA
jgi:hypothetical protein